MQSEPTLIVLAPVAGGPRPVDDGALAGTLRHAIESELPVLVVAGSAQADGVARWVARDDIVVIDEATARRGAGYAIAHAVGRSADAGGWLVLPAELDRVRPATLRSMAEALSEHPAVVAQHRGRRGPLTGFGAELYSELVAPEGDDALRRLLARYPVLGVEVDDPGVLPTPPESSASMMRRASG